MLQKTDYPLTVKYEVTKFMSSLIFTEHKKFSYNLIIKKEMQKLVVYNTAKQYAEGNSWEIIRNKTLAGDLTLDTELLIRYFNTKLLEVI